MEFLEDMEVLLVVYEIHGGVVHILAHSSVGVHLMTNYVTGEELGRVLGRHGSLGCSV